MRPAWALIAALTLGCSAPRASSLPAPPPALEDPALFVPADLDLVLRLDLRRLRATWANAAESILKRVEPQVGSDPSDRATRQLLTALLEKADTVWIAARPRSRPELTDTVIVLRGKFENTMPNELGGEPKWSSPRLLAGGLVRFEREPSKLRAAPSVIYWRGPDLVVLGSVAELDALERSLELGQTDVALRPPDTGLLTAAARVNRLQQELAAQAPVLAELTEGAQQLDASLDRDGDRFTARFDLTFERPARAQEVSQALGETIAKLRSRERPWLDAIQIQPLERDVSLRVELSADEFSRLLSCWRGC